MSFLQAQPDLEVRPKLPVLQVIALTVLRPAWFQLLVWPEDRACERAWLEANIGGAAGVIVMISDLVSGSSATIAECEGD